jgi:integrase
MHFSHGAYYFVQRVDGRVKWQFLSRDYGDALRIYAGIVAPCDGGMGDLLDRWFAGKEVAVNTRKTYAVAVDRLRKAFAEFTPVELKPKHFYEFIAKAKITPAMAAHYRSVMIGTMQLAVKEGLVDTNLMRQVESFVGKKRNRYLEDGEYLAIREQATPTLQVVMDLCYLTGQRIGDVLAIRHADLTDNGIVFEQQKTGARLCVAWSDDLRSVVAEAKALHQSLRGMTLLHTRQGKVFAYWTIRTLWERACSGAGIIDAHIHDIRAKSATDAKKAGVDSMALLGHKSEAVHQRYLRSKETPVVEGIRRIKC